MKCIKKKILWKFLIERLDKFVRCTFTFTFRFSFTTKYFFYFRPKSCFILKISFKSGPISVGKTRYSWCSWIYLSKLFFAILKVFSSLFIYFVFFCETKHPINKLVFPFFILHYKHAIIVILWSKPIRPEQISS
jgi:hypothetical protein